MRTAVAGFIVSLVIGSILTPVVRRLALRIGAVDHATSFRKIHSVPIPRVGGIAMVAAFYVPLLGLLAADSAVGHLFYASHGKAVGLLVGGVIIAALGIYDDVRGAGAPLKFTVQFGVAALMYVLGYRIESIANPFGDAIQLGLLGFPFTLLWITGVINAINLIDGLDGLAGGVALISVLTTCAAALHHGQPLMVLFTAVLAGSIVGFLRYNFNPASIFMGDTGSMFLGFVISTTAIQTHQESSAAVAILVPVIMLGVPIVDTLLAIVRRGVRGVPLFAADRGHIHHKLLDLGLTQREAVLALYSASAVLALVALAFAAASAPIAAALLVTIGSCGGLVLRRLGYFRIEGARNVLDERRRNLRVRRAMRQICVELREANTVAEAWPSIRRAAAAFGADCVNLRVLERGPGGAHPHTWSEGFDGIDVPFFRTKHSVRGDPDSASIEMGWRDRAAVDRDTQLAIEILCAEVRGALERVAVRGSEVPSRPAAASTRR